jgi:hypothetical protein
VSPAEVHQSKLFLHQPHLFHDQQGINSSPLNGFRRSAQYLPDGGPHELTFRPDYSIGAGQILETGVARR